MKLSANFKKIIISLYNYFIFFLLMAFVITCCITLFLNTMTRAMDITLSAEDISIAAKLTFANVIFLSLLCSVIDGIRRKWTITRPTDQIAKATKKMIQGDFSVRLKHAPGFLPHSNDSFNEIIDCFNQMAEELSGIETLRTDFIANVSHELKTPLSVIQNYGTLLQSPDLSDKKRLEYAKAITASSRKLADLISNILKLNKLENQQIFPTTATYDLGEQLCQCLLGFEDIWERKQLDIETEIEDNVFVKADAEMLSLVWNNLFSNAMKFTDPGGKVTLSLKSADNYAIIKVSDTGCGISKEVGQHMFEKFYQGDTSHKSQGNGLGLSLVKRVIAITGSDISVESELGKGTTFTVKMLKESYGTTEENRI